MLTPFNTCANLQGGVSFEIRTPTVKFGGSGKVTSISSTSCGKYLLRGLQSGSILITEMLPPSSQTLRAKNAANDGSGLKMTPLEIAQQTTSSSLYWSHNLVNTTHLGAITSISCNESGLVAIASEDQTISVIHLATLLGPLSGLQSNLGQQLSASVNSKSTLDNYTLPTTRLHEHTQGIVQIKILNDGRVFSISKDHTLKISDASSSTRIASFSFPSALTCFALSPNEETVYLGAQDGNIYKIDLWDIVSKPSSALSSTTSMSNPTNAFGANYDWTSSITSSLAEWAAAESSTDVSAVMDASLSNAKTKTTNLMDVEPNAYRGHLQPVSSLSLSLDGSRIVSSSMDGVAIIWDERTCQAIHKISPVKGVGVAWSNVLCRPSTQNNSASKFRVDTTQREKSSLPFALVQKAQNAIGAPFGYITVPLGEHTLSLPAKLPEHQSSAEHTLSPTSLIQLDLTQSVQDITSAKSNAEEIEQIGMDLAERLVESHTSETENLKNEVERLKALVEKWKELNNSMFNQQLASTLQ